MLSEGTLRLLTLCILEFDNKYTGLLCFEEPENGIHPFRIGATAQLLKDLTSSFGSDEDLLRQVIVNTHSPILITSLVKWQNDKNVSVWLSKQNTLIKAIDAKKIKLKVTRTSPVVKISDKSRQLMLPFISSIHEQKLTLTEVEKYLNTGEAEEAIKIINS